MSDEQTIGDEPSIEDMVFDLAWRACTKVAEATVLADEATFPEIPTEASQKAFNQRMDEICDSDSFTSELDAMQDRIEAAIIQQTCVCCGGLIDDDGADPVNGLN